MTTEFTTIIHNLVLDNSMPAKELAKAIGKPYSTLLREVNPYDTGAKLGAESLFQIMQVTGNYKPLEFMAERCGLELNGVKGQVPHIIPGSFANLNNSMNIFAQEQRQEMQMQQNSASCPTCGNSQYNPAEQAYGEMLR